MLPLLFPFMVDTVEMPPPDFSDLFVNEWGVVVFNTDGTTVAGAPDQYGDINGSRQVYGDLAVDAPVIWIHGAFFEDATLSVKIPHGSLTTIFPKPDATAGEETAVAASWRISASPSVLTRPALVVPPGTPFEWAMEYWREVPSMELYSLDSGEYMSNFLYYEAGIPNWNPPEGVYEAKTLAGYYATDGLLITVGDTPEVERIQLIPLPDGSGTPADMAGEQNDDSICAIICDWGGNNLKSEEISALWQTWKPFFVSGSIYDESSWDRRDTNEQWILFPLPWDAVENYSTIHLEVHDLIDREITYNRLFLGLVRVN
jgi:hypothetical protein